MRKNLLLIIYTEYKPSTDYTTKTGGGGGGENKEIFLLKKKLFFVKPRFLKTGWASHILRKGVNKLLRVIAIFTTRFQ